MLYFAYGSNLSERGWAAWCGRNGFDPSNLRGLSQAWLPDYEWAFGYRSKSRGGGALDVRPRRGSLTPGALFEVVDFDALDAKEGVESGCYERKVVPVLTDDGAVHVATTYVVTEQRAERFVAPADAYVDEVVEGLARFRHDTKLIHNPSRDQRVTPATTSLFVYGTLMSTGPRFDLVLPHLVAAPARAEVQGVTRVDVQGYPGLRRGGTELVAGELLMLDPRSVDAAFGPLDDYERFSGYTRESMYHRTLCRADVAGRDGASAQAQLCWLYTAV